MAKISDENKLDEAILENFTFENISNEELLSELEKLSLISANTPKIYEFEDINWQNFTDDVIDLNYDGNIIWDNSINDFRNCSFNVDRPSSRRNLSIGKVEFCKLLGLIYRRIIALDSIINEITADDITLSKFMNDIVKAFKKSNRQDGNQQKYKDIIKQWKDIKEQGKVPVFNAKEQKIIGNDNIKETYIDISNAVLYKLLNIIYYNYDSESNRPFLLELFRNMRTLEPKELQLGGTIEDGCGFSEKTGRCNKDSSSNHPEWCEKNKEGTRCILSSEGKTNPKRKEISIAANNTRKEKNEEKKARKQEQKEALKKPFNVAHIIELPKSEQKQKNEYKVYWTGFKDRMVTYENLKTLNTFFGDETKVQEIMKRIKDSSKKKAPEKNKTKFSVKKILGSSKRITDGEETLLVLWNGFKQPVISEETLEELKEIDSSITSKVEIFKNRPKIDNISNQGNLEKDITAELEKAKAELEKAKAKIGNNEEESSDGSDAGDTEEVSGETKAEIVRLEQIIKVLKNNLDEINIIKKSESKTQKIDFNINHVWITGTISNFKSEKSSFDVTVSKEDNEMLPCNIFNNLMNKNDRSGNIKKLDYRTNKDTYWAPVYIKHGYSEVCKNKLLSKHHESCKKYTDKGEYKGKYCLKIISTLEDLKDRKKILEKKRENTKAKKKEIENLEKDIEEEQKKPLSAATCNFKIQEGDGNSVIKEHESYNIGKFGLTRDRKSYPCIIAYDDVIRKNHKIIFKMELIRDKKIIKIKKSDENKGIEGFIKSDIKAKISSIHTDPKPKKIKGSIPTIFNTDFYRKGKQGKFQLYEFKKTEEKRKMCPDDIKSDDFIEVYDDKENELFVAKIINIKKEGDIPIFTIQKVNDDGSLETEKVLTYNEKEERYKCSHLKDYKLDTPSVTTQDGGGYTIRRPFQILIKIDALYKFMNNQYESLMKRVYDIINERFNRGKGDNNTAITKYRKSNECFAKKRMGDWGQIIICKMKGYIFVTFDKLAFLFAMLCNVNCILQENVKGVENIEHSYNYLCYKQDPIIDDVSPPRSGRQGWIPSKSSEKRNMGRNILLEGPVYEALKKYVKDKYKSDSKLPNPDDRNYDDKFKTLLHFLMMIYDTHHDWGKGGNRPKVDFKNLFSCFNIDDILEKQIKDLYCIISRPKGDLKSESCKPSKITFENDMVETTVNIFKKQNSEKYKTQIKKYYFNILSHYNKDKFKEMVDRHFPIGFDFDLEYWGSSSQSNNIPILAIHIYDFFSELVQPRILIDALQSFNLFYYMVNKNLFRYEVKTIKNYYNLYDAASKGFNYFRAKGMLENKLQTDFLLNHIGFKNDELLNISKNENLDTNEGTNLDFFDLEKLSDDFNPGDNWDQKNKAISVEKLWLESEYFSKEKINECELVQAPNSKKSDIVPLIDNLELKSNDYPIYKFFYILRKLHTKYGDPEYMGKKIDKMFREYNIVKKKIRKGKVTRETTKYFDKELNEIHHI